MSVITVHWHRNLFVKSNGLIHQQLGANNQVHIKWTLIYSIYIYTHFIDCFSFILFGKTVSSIGHHGSPWQLDGSANCWSDKWPTVIKLTHPCRLDLDRRAPYGPNPDVVVAGQAVVVQGLMQPWLVHCCWHMPSEALDPWFWWWALPLLAPAPLGALWAGHCGSMGQKYFWYLFFTV